MPTSEGRHKHLGDKVVDCGVADASRDVPVDVRRVSLKEDGELRWLGPGHLDGRGIVGSIPMWVRHYFLSRLMHCSR